MNNQLRNSQTSILAIQVGNISHVLQMIDTAARLVRAHGVNAMMIVNSDN